MQLLYPVQILGRTTFHPHHKRNAAGHQKEAQVLPVFLLCNQMGSCEGTGDGPPRFHAWRL
jgi:hypothetical protein